MTTRATLKPINAYTTLIDDDGRSTAYLLCGRDRALLIDTLNGAENLLEIIRTVTDLPVTVVNTHGHIDHIGGNHFFPEARIHRADANLYREHLGYLRAELREQGVATLPTGEECIMHDLQPGTVFDLGGVVLEVVPIPGHTAGSVALLDRAARLLYTGDAVNSSIWMHLDHSTALSAYLAALNALDPLRPAFDGLYGGHVREAVPAPAAYIDVMKRGVEEVLAGETNADEDWQWYDMKARRHRLGEDGWLVYDPKRVG